jgi:hypothetical protein
VTSEKRESIGRLDLEAVFAGFTHVFELKMTDDVSGGPEAALDGMMQIRDRGYGLASVNPVLVSLAVGRRERNAVAFIFEKDGRGMCFLPLRHGKYLEGHEKRRKSEMVP